MLQHTRLDADEVGMGELYGIAVLVNCPIKVESGVALVVVGCCIGVTVRVGSIAISNP